MSNAFKPFALPPAPSHLRGEVKAWLEPVVIPTYETAPPQKNPMFLENRVYQGSSGRVYPLPCIERVEQQAHSRAWQAAHIENEYLRVMILPELGGRIHVALDKTNGYDFFYRQNVIKPALVGLAGPWISGGVEFNWPQHHRPATYMPVEVSIEEHGDGSRTIWLSDHDPMERMKGAHGVCLYPGKAYLEVKVRLYNRTPFTQTFLWWANVAVRVDGNYQSFFPPDVHYVADHAKRAISTFPLSRGTYYGIDYAARAEKGIPPDEMPERFRPRADVPPNDLSWYANIPVPTSYMALGSHGDFFGGYDHGRHAGFVHVANHHIAPGKKQWTWGNSEFGYAWERNLTDNDGPYIELMAGVYTDNQPDFSFLAPGETKTFEQHWFPIQQIGIPQKANRRAAIAFHIEGASARIGLSVTEKLRSAGVVLSLRNAAGEWEKVAQERFDTEPGAPVNLLLDLPSGAEEFCIEARDAQDGELIRYCTNDFSRADATLPQPATEPPAPERIQSTDELYLTGLHLWQYRHATRSPEPYWCEALRRDPGDSRVNNVLGAWHLRRGEFELAERHLRAAIDRLTSRNPNPPEGEAHYYLGLCLRHLERDSEAYDTFYKSVWNYATRSCGYYALAQIDSKEQRWEAALDHAKLALPTNADHANARNLAAMILRKLGREREAADWIEETLRIDPTDGWARYLRDQILPEDRQRRLDLVFDFANAGFYREACAILEAPNQEWTSGTAPIRCYALAWLYAKLGEQTTSSSWLETAERQSPDYCFPSRLEEMVLLQFAIAEYGSAAKAHYYLGNFLYDRRRYREAIENWEASAQLDPKFATVWRNLGIAYFNVKEDAARAHAAFEKAFALDPHDARVFYERDQLWKRTGTPPRRRLSEFEAHRPLVSERDDLSVELAALYQQTERYEDALSVLLSRRFQPWEGGEGLALGEFVRAHVALGRRALERNDFAEAKRHFETALTSPENLGEAKHVLVNQAHVYYWLGVACELLGQNEEARKWWLRARSHARDFQEMSVKQFSEMTYYRALASERLGDPEVSRALLDQLLAYARELAASKPTIDYFATSLPSMLLFREDLRTRNQLTADFLRAQALAGLRKLDESRETLHSILARDPNHALAADFRNELSLVERMACTGRF
ncbi:MAG TPA: DUF5107 domain-containing protein [Bryobacteraceae bacterium]|jgi:tetratricopeptide (TPR) repeat protein|nr:DUF5107 domain-containing protein [Bryobacteraceae bacterium]